MDEEARRMAHEDHHDTAGKDTGMTVDDTPPPRRSRKRKMVKQPVNEPKRISNKSTAAVSGDEAAAPTANDAQSKKPKKRVSEKQAAKHATMIACNSTAMNLFSESDELRKLNEKIQELQAELKHQKELNQSKLVY